MCTITGIYTIIEGGEEVVEDVAGAETERGGAGVEGGEMVEGVCDCDGFVFGAIRVGVANKGGFVVVVKLYSKGREREQLEACHENV